MFPVFSFISSPFCVPSFSDIHFSWGVFGLNLLLRFCQNVSGCFVFLTIWQSDREECLNSFYTFAVYFHRSECACLSVLPVIFSHREAENKSALIRECLSIQLSHKLRPHTRTYTHRHALFKAAISNRPLNYSVSPLYSINCACVCLSSGFWWLQRLNIPSISVSFFRRWWWFESPCQRQLDCICDLWAGRKCPGRVEEMKHGAKGTIANWQGDREEALQTPTTPTFILRNWGRKFLRFLQKCFY